MKGHEWQFKQKIGSRGPVHTGPEHLKEGAGRRGNGRILGLRQTLWTEHFTNWAAHTRHPQTDGSAGQSHGRPAGPEQVSTESAPNFLTPGRQGIQLKLKRKRRKVNN